MLNHLTTQKMNTIISISILTVLAIMYIRSLYPHGTKVPFAVKIAWNIYLCFSIMFSCVLIASVIELIVDYVNNINISLYINHIKNFLNNNMETTLITLPLALGVTPVLKSKKSKNEWAATQIELINKLGFNYYKDNIVTSWNRDSNGDRVGVSTERSRNIYTAPKGCNSVLKLLELISKIDLKGCDNEKNLEIVLDSIKVLKNLLDDKDGLHILGQKQRCVLRHLDKLYDLNEVKVSQKTTKKDAGLEARIGNALKDSKPGPQTMEQLLRNEWFELTQPAKSGPATADPKKDAAANIDDKKQIMIERAARARAAKAAKAAAASPESVAKDVIAKHEPAKELAAVQARLLELMQMQMTVTATVDTHNVRINDVANRIERLETLLGDLID